jgi:glycosyltransferase involved in cell wall biosynthesis
MRIAMLLTQDRGGPVDVAVQLAIALRDTGDHDVRIFGPKPARDAALLGPCHEELIIPTKFSLAAIRQMRSRLREWRPDIVHAQDRRSSIVVAGMSRGRSGLGTVYTYHGLPDDVTEQWFNGSPTSERPCRYSRAVLAADAAVARTIDRVVVPSSAMGGFLRRRLRVPDSRIVHIDNGIRLPPACPPIGPVRRLLFVGLLIPRKGLLDLLEALSRPGTMPSDATLTVVGDGPQRGEAERLATALSLHTRVDFVGFRTDVADILADHDALIVPSRLEQQPLVIAEAMGAGKPVVATRTGGVSEMLDVKEAFGHLIAPGDVDELATSLRRLFALRDPGVVGFALAQRAAQRYSAEESARAHAVMYQDLVRCPTSAGTQRLVGSGVHDVTFTGRLIQ